MIDGYNQRQRPMGEYFRQTFALLYNINRGEKTEAIEPQDVLALPGETRKQARTRKPKPLTGDRLQSLLDRINNPPPIAE